VVNRVSVVIPTYNYGRFIAEAIASVLNQTHAVEETIVIDDGSTDETEAVVRVFGDRVRYVRQDNAGVCAARNKGVVESSGEFIAFLDADDTWEPTKIGKQLAKFAEDEEIGLVHCSMREFDNETGETISFHLDGEEGWVADDLLLSERPAINGPGGAIMVSRNAFNDVGGFDERIAGDEQIVVEQKPAVSRRRVNERNNSCNEQSAASRPDPRRQAPLNSPLPIRDESSLCFLRLHKQIAIAMEK
jgi:glycosyltransferase involved in cell wall biosynthesis